MGSYQVGGVNLEDLKSVEDSIDVSDVNAPNNPMHKTESDMAPLPDFNEMFKFDLGQLSELMANFEKKIAHNSKQMREMERSQKAAEHQLSKMQVKFKQGKEKSRKFNEAFTNKVKEIESKVIEAHPEFRPSPDEPEDDLDKMANMESQESPLPREVRPSGSKLDVTKLKASPEDFRSTVKDLIAEELFGPGDFKDQLAELVRLMVPIPEGRSQMS